MRIAHGRVVGGRVELDGELPEGATVAVLATDGDETFEVDAETKRVLLTAIEQCRNGQTDTDGQSPRRSSQSRMRRSLEIVVTDITEEKSSPLKSGGVFNRPKAPGAIAEALERASSLIAAQPGVGSTARDADLAGVRRLHLARVRYDLYYRVNEDLERIEVLAFWHASRGRRPVL